MNYSDLLVVFETRGWVRTKDEVGDNQLTFSTDGDLFVSMSIRGKKISGGTKYRLGALYCSRRVTEVIASIYDGPSELLGQLTYKNYSIEVLDGCDGVDQVERLISQVAQTADQTNEEEEVLRLANTCDRMDGVWPIIHVAANVVLRNTEILEAYLSKTKSSCENPFPLVVSKELLQRAVVLSRPRGD